MKAAGEAGKAAHSEGDRAAPCAGAGLDNAPSYSSISDQSLDLSSLAQFKLEEDINHILDKVKINSPQFDYINKMNEQITEK